MAMATECQRIVFLSMEGIGCLRSATAAEGRPPLSNESVVTIAFPPVAFCSSITGVHYFSALLDTVAIFLKSSLNTSDQ